jgi:cytochrome c oxidase subunit 3
MLTTIERAPKPPPELHLQEQFETPEQQEYAATLGMWAFMATEFLLIGVLFVAYLVCRMRWPEAFRRGSSEMHYWLGFFETAIILTTSFLVTLALRAAKLGANRQVILLFASTVILGAGFLSIKGTEYYLEYGEGLVPGYFQTIPPKEAGLPPAQQHPRPIQERLFMLFYYLLTATHAIHMTVGMVLLSVIAFFTWRGKYSKGYHTPIELVGIYWHFVDLVWIMVFASVYLLRQ